MKLNELIQELRDEADLCQNDGVTDLACLLDEAARKLERMSVWIECEALTTDTCTIDILDRSCDGCECGRVAEMIAKSCGNDPPKPA